MNRLLTLPVFAALALATAGCSSTPGGVLAPDDMAELLADLEIGESIVENDPSSWRSDSVKMVLRQSIYARHGVTSEEVDSSLAWYGAHVEKMPEVYRQVTDILDRRLKKAREASVGKIEQPTAVTEDGDSVNIWPLDPTWLFARERRAADIITFNLERDRNFETGDTYTLRYKIVSGEADTRSTLAAQYTSGVNDYTTRQSRNARGWQSVALTVDSALSTSSVFGAIGITPVGNADVIVDSVSLVRQHQRQGRCPVTTQKFRSRR